MRAAILFLAVFVLTGCGSDDGDGAGEKKAGVIPQHQLDAMDKARGVEDTLKAEEEKRREQIEKSGG
jgi:hypothetical protein